MNQELDLSKLTVEQLTEIAARARAMAVKKKTMVIDPNLKEVAALVDGANRLAMAQKVQAVDVLRAVASQMNLAVVVRKERDPNAPKQGRPKKQK